MNNAGLMAMPERRTADGFEMQREFAVYRSRAASLVAHPGLSNTDSQVHTVAEGGAGWV